MEGICHTNGGMVLHEIMLNVRDQGFFVDDKNLPVSENILVASESSTTTINETKNVNKVTDQWIYDGACYRWVTKAQDCQGLKKKNSTDQVKFCRLQCFGMMMPKQFITTIILVTMNKKLPPRTDQISYESFFNKLGLYFFNGNCARAPVQRVLVWTTNNHVQTDPVLCL